MVFPLNMFLESAKAKLNADLIVITGDLIDIYEGETPYGSLLADQIDYFKMIVQKSPTPLLLTLGNHDITTYYSGLNPAQDDHQFHAQRARADWITNLSCFRQGTYYSRPVRVGNTTYRFIFGDNSYKGVFHGVPGYLPGNPRAVARPAAVYRLQKKVHLPRAEP